MTPAGAAARALRAAAAAVDCVHCGLPVRPRRDDEPAFCCVGCRLAHAVAGGGGERGLLEARLLAAAVLSMAVMTASLVLYGHDLLATGAEPGLELLTGLGRSGLALLSLGVLVLLAPPLLAGALDDLRGGTVRMDGLIVLAVGAAWGLSAFHAWTGQGEIYFDTATMVLLLVTLGRRLEAHARRAARDAAGQLSAEWPERALRLGPDGAEQSLRPDELVVGDVCRVPPGGIVPADLVVIEGAGDVVVAHVTGEQLPRRVGPGAAVPSGAANGTAELRGRVVRPAGTSALGRLAALLDAPLGLTPAMRTADRLAGVLVIVSLVLAVGGAWRAAVTATSEPWGAALQVALSVLVVACPCALGLATPLAYRALRAALARRGVLVHDAAALERAARVDLALLDKTGTLTEPASEVRPALFGAPESRRRLAALVGRSGHPLAAAFALDDGAAPRDLAVDPGGGVSGRLDGLALAAGSPAWLARRGARWPDDLAARCAEARAAGDAIVGLAEEGRVTAAATVASRLRPTSGAAVADLVALGVRVEIVTGDHAGAAEAVARVLGVSARADCTPDDKRELVRASRRAGRVVLLAGDGLNDAPALAAADVGVAMAGGAGATRGRAHAELIGDDPRGLAVLIEGARRLRRVVAGNLAWAVAYNAIALLAAAAGRLPPLLAVGVMIVSSLVVSGRSHRLLGWTPAGAAVAA